MNEEDERIINQWKADLDVIRNQILNIKRYRTIHRRLMEVIEENPQINRRNDLFDFIIEGYAALATLAVRRLIDARKGVISFPNLVASMRKNLEIITRDEFVNAYPDFLKEDGTADCAFDEYAGKGNSKLSKRSLQEKLDDTNQTCNKIKKYVNNFLAHRARNSDASIPTYEDLNGAIDRAVKLYEELLFIVTRGGSFVDVISEDTSNWEWVLHEPWIPVKSERQS